MKFGKLSEYLKELEDTSSRNEITELLAELFKESSVDEIDKIVYLILGRLAPGYESVVFNIAERMMVESIAQAYNTTKDKVQKLYKSEGDLGLTAEALADEKNKGLTVLQVFEKLTSIAKEEGEGSQEKKIDGMANLLSQLDSLSSRYVARIPMGKLRLGFSDKTVIDALSYMQNGDKSAKKELTKAYEVTPDVGMLAKKVKKYGIKKAAEDKKPTVGIPVLPMLAQRLKKPEEMIKKMGKVAIEPKLDGLRIQIHYKKGEPVKAYTRNLNETSWMFPELEEMGKYVNAKELILDSEAVGLDESRKKIANFQQTMTRRRKHGVSERASQIPIKFYVFDVLLRNGESEMNKTYPERREVLEKSVKEGPLFNIVDDVVTDDPEVIAEEEKRKVEEGLEGIIIKKYNAKYVSGRTGWRWVKMKEAEEMHAKLSDTVDCIVMGYTAGRGKRVQFGIGQFLAGVRDGLKVKTLTKVGTGLTDDQFRELKKRLSKLQVKEKPKQYDVDKNLVPDFWVEPALVVELAADEITKSPNHTAGYALRFPRLIKFRDDKDAEKATSLEEIKELYKIQ